MGLLDSNLLRIGAVCRLEINRHGVKPTQLTQICHAVKCY